MHELFLRFKYLKRKIVRTILLQRESFLKTVNYQQLQCFLSDKFIHFLSFYYDPTFKLASRTILSFNMLQVHCLTLCLSALSAFNELVFLIYITYAIYLMKFPCISLSLILHLLSRTNN